MVSASTRSRLDSCAERNERAAERNTAPSGGGAWRYWLTVYLPHTYTGGCVCRSTCTGIGASVYVRSTA